MSSISPIYKKIILLLSLIFIIVIFKFRYLNPDKGFASYSWDYGSHIAIISALEDRNFFPEIHKQKVSTHGIAKWMPLYHGLIGSHLLAIGLNKLGIPLPGAMQLLIDLSLLLVFYLTICIPKMDLKQRLLVLISFIVVYFSTHAILTFDGFFSLLVCTGVFTLAVLFYQKSYNKTALCIWLISISFYPETTLWVLPAIAYLAHYRKSFGRWNLPALALSILIFIIIFSVFLKRILLYGAINLSITSYAIFIFLMLVAYKPIKLNFKKEFPFLISYFSLSLFFVIICWFSFSEIPYYLMKMTIWGSFLVPYILSRVQIPMPKVLIILTTPWIIFFRAPQPLSYLKAVQSYIFSDSQFNNHQYLESYHLRNKYSSCNTSLFLYLENETLAHSNIHVLTLARNSMFRNFDLYTAEFNTPLLPKKFKSVGDLDVIFKSSYLKFFDENIAEIKHNLRNTDGSCLFFPENLVNKYFTPGEFRIESETPWSVIRGQ